MVKIYTSPTCGTCKMIKMKLSKKNIPYDETHDIKPLMEKGI